MHQKDYPNHTLVWFHLFHIICEADESVGRARVGDHHQNLGTPKLDVALTNVQTKEILAYLVVDECLGDIPPGSGRTSDQ